jgi:hypothetical protein
MTYWWIMEADAWGVKSKALQHIIHGGQAYHGIDCDKNRFYWRKHSGSFCNDP